MITDAGAAATSEWLGIGVSRGVGAIIIAAGLPEIAVGGSAIGISILVGVGIDMLGDLIKKSHYRSD